MSMDETHGTNEEHTAEFQRAVRARTTKLRTASTVNIRARHGTCLLAHCIALYMCVVLRRQDERDKQQLQR